MVCASEKRQLNDGIRWLLSKFAHYRNRGYSPVSIEGSMFEVNVGYYEPDGVTVKSLVEYPNCKSDSVHDFLTALIQSCTYSSGLLFSAKGVQIRNFDGTGLDVFTWTLSTKMVPVDYDFNKSYLLRYFLFSADANSSLQPSIIIQFERDRFLFKRKFG